MHPLNLFFSLILGFLTLEAHAINLHALYTASCQRHVGVILGVTPRHLALLNLEGNIVNVERYEVIYYVNYPLDKVPMASIENPEQVPQVTVKTFQNGELETLVVGWPVDFSADRVSFLSLKGLEVSIDRRSIWDIRFDTRNGRVAFPHVTKQFEFVPPYAFANCATEKKKLIKVFPQDVLSDPVKIKREFDRLEDSHRRLQKYETEEHFYPVPEIYTNQTLLGLWLMAGSRYGASDNRTNNFTPLLSNEFSSGPFGFQSEFRSGSGLLNQTIHEETQTQVYYRMKADYFHLSAFFDPNLILVGDKYKWGRDDLKSNDLRAIESGFLEMGFDWGAFALEVYMGTSLNVGAREQDYVKEDTLSLPRIGIRYQGYTWILSAQVGSGSTDIFKGNFFRANFEYKPSKNWRYAVSALSRNLKFDGKDSNTNTPFRSESKSLTVAGDFQFRFHTRYWAGLNFALEQVGQTGSLNGGADQSENHVYPKLGTMVSLSF